MRLLPLSLRGLSTGPARRRAADNPFDDLSDLRDIGVETDEVRRSASDCLLFPLRG